MDPPSGRVPEQGPDWFLLAIEACGSGTPDLGLFSGVFVFIGIFGVGLTSRGSPSHPRDRGRAQGVGTPPTLVGSPRLLWPNFDALWSSFGPEKILKNWHVNWTPFDILFIRNTEKGKKTAILGWASG